MTKSIPTRRSSALAQPALVAYQTAMAALLADWGVVPEAVLGHSLGEYAAAIVAGAAEPDPVLTLVAARGRSEEHTSELQSTMRNSYAVFCLEKIINHN